MATTSATNGKGANRPNPEWTPARKAELERYPDKVKLIPLYKPYATLTDLHGRVKDAGKVPLNKHWQKRRYDSKETIAKAYAEERNVGVRLPDTILIVDVDFRAGGEKGFLNLCHDIGIDGDKYPRVITGSGSFHVYMRIPPGLLVLDTLGEEGDDTYAGVEFKSKGRQVVAAGSLHPSGGLYRWSPDHPRIEDGIPKAPTSLLKAITRPPRDDSKSNGGGEYTSDVVAAKLAMIDPTKDGFEKNSKWFKIMAACHKASGGDARQEFIDWSTSDPKFAKDAYGIGKRWDSLHLDRGNLITGKSLDWFVTEYGDPSKSGPPVIDGDEFPDDDGDTPEGAAADFETMTDTPKGAAADFESMADGDKAPKLDAETGINKDELIERAKKLGYRMMPMFHDELNFEKMLDFCERGFKKGNAPLFQMAGRIVHPYRTLTASHSDDEIRRPKNALVIEGVEDVRLNMYMTQHAPFYRIIKPPRGGEPVLKLMPAPMKLTAQYIARKDKRGLRPLTGIIETPTLRSDGTVLQKAGYDEASGIMLDLGGTKYPTIPEEPTREDALAAMADLKRPFKDFPFIPDGPLDDNLEPTSASRSVMLSGVLTAVVRRSLPTAPAHGVSATTPGTGKTLAIQTASMIAMGREATATNQGANEEENEKRFGSLLLDGDQVILIDNCELPVTGASVCAIMTASTWKGRTLGKTEHFSVPTSSLFFFNGNALVFGKDMTRRALLCQMDAQTEFPEERKFDVNLEEWVPKNRVKLVVAALTVLRAFVVAGRPGLDTFKPLGNFRAWSNLVRGALIWLGEPDPVLTQKAIRKKDPTKTTLNELFAAIHDSQLKGKWFSAGDLYAQQSATEKDGEIIAANERISDALDAVLRRNDKQGIGYYLAPKANVIVGGMQLQVEEDKHRKTNVYRVFKMKRPK